MAGVFVVAACAMVGSSSVVRMVSVTRDVGARCGTVWVWLGHLLSYAVTIVCPTIHHDDGTVTCA
jgi:hypothetical protein